ncbi:hypothetical protein F5X96DRAFT_5852 [Biscogniauxia mediterranea]|nr:hypothetical protein F5X96DRAFT_5852 [Biscogniauxia mediterranea]
MAQAMGFSSFGAKRRRFNPSTDAVVASSSNPTVPLFQTAHHAPGSGSNATPLGSRTRNQDEIDIDADDDEQHTAPDTDAKARGRDGQDGNDDGLEPQQMDTGSDIQSRIDNIIGVSAPEQGSAYFASQTADGHEGNQWSRGGGRGRGRGRGQGRGRGGNQGNRGGGQGHDSGHNWWEDYYDPWSVTNPWEKLEKKLGLEPRDTFLTWEEAKTAKTFI